MIPRLPAVEGDRRDDQDMLVRLRTDSDLHACEQLVKLTHDSDGYPLRLPDDLRRFVEWPGSICAWVAESNGAVIGHVALHSQGSPEAMSLASRMTGERAEHLAVVARLLVSPAARRAGLGRRLLRTASAQAEKQGLIAMLEVVAGLAPAIALYESCGWVRAGRTAVQWRSTTDIMDELVYLAPGSAMLPPSSLE